LLMPFQKFKVSRCNLFFRSRELTARMATTVFDNVRDAVKEDSDSEGNHSSDGGADDEHEYGEEFEGEEEDVRTPFRKQEGRFSKSTPILVNSSPAPTSDLAPASDFEGLRVHDNDSLTDSSIAPSLRREASSVSRITSEGESSGTERGSIIKTLASLWSYKGAEYTPLEFPLCVYVPH
jgi:1-phosphatidylinositol-3-phosphate 5-kinase